MSIKKESLEKLKDKKFKGAPAWAIWGKNVRDFVSEESILEKAKPQYVFLGLNPSNQDTGVVPEENLWQGFHLTGNDNKLKVALENTPFEGAYLTDLLKTQWESDSSKIQNWMKNPENVAKLEENLNLLRDEIDVLRESLSAEISVTIISMHSTVTEFFTNINQYSISQELKNYFSTFTAQNGTFTSIPHYADRFHGNGTPESYCKNVHEKLGIIS